MNFHLFNFTLIILIITPKLTYSANSQKTNIEDYLIATLNNVEAPRISTLTSENALEKIDSQSGWGTSFTLYPNTYKSRTNQLYNTYSQGLSTTLEQQTPISTSLSISYDYNNQIENSPLKYKTQTIKISLSQPLWRDFFGNQRRIIKNILTFQHEVAAIQNEKEKSKSCIASIELFTSLFYEQERNKTLKNILNTSEELLKKTKNAFQKRMIQKSSLIASESDFLSTQELFENSEVSLKKIKNNIFIESEMYIKEAADPSQFFKQISNESITIDTHKNENYNLKVAQAEVQAASEQLKLKKELRKPDLNLIATVGKNIQIQNPTPLDTKENYYEVGVKLILPLWNPSSHFDLDEAQRQLQIAELNYQKTSKATSIEKFSYDSEISNFEKLLQNVDRKISLFNENSKIAYKELESGKISFQEYLIIRDKSLNQEIKKIEIQNQYWSLLLRQFESSGVRPKPCLLALKDLKE